MKEDLTEKLSCLSLSFQTIYRIKTEDFSGIRTRIVRKEGSTLTTWSPPRSKSFLVLTREFLRSPWATTKRITTQGLCSYLRLLPYLSSSRWTHADTNEARTPTTTTRPKIERFFDFSPWCLSKLWWQEVGNTFLQNNARQSKTATLMLNDERREQSKQFFMYNCCVAELDVVCKGREGLLVNVK